MSAPRPPFPETCLAVQARIQADPLNLPEADWEHLRRCAACTEAQVAWLAQEETQPALTPGDYFENLPARVLAKLPAPPRRPKGHPLGWAAAGILLLAGGGGFLLGRRAGTPAVASATLAPLPHEGGYEVLPDTPFLEALEGQDPLVPSRHSETGPLENLQPEPPLAPPSDSRP